MTDYRMFGRHLATGQAVRTDRRISACGRGVPVPRLLSSRFPVSRSQLALPLHHPHRWGHCRRHPPPGRGGNLATGREGGPPPTHPHVWVPACRGKRQPGLTWPGAPAVRRATRSGFRGSGASAPRSRSTGTSSRARAQARTAPPGPCGWPCGRPPPAAAKV